MDNGAATARAAAPAADLSGFQTPPLEFSFPGPSRLTSRDIFRLIRGAWPFIRPYKRHLLYMFLAMIPMVPLGLGMFVLIRVFFDVVGNGHPLTRAEAWFLRVPLAASRPEVLWHGCIAAAVLTLIGVPIAIFVFGYAVWILQRISNLFRVSLYARLQELSVRFHSEEKIGDAIFRMFQDSAAIPQVINGLVIQPLRWFPAAAGDLLWLALFSYPMALIAAALIPANLIVAWLFAAPLRRAFLRARETSAIATTRVEETLAAVKAVKAFGREAEENRIYAGENWESFVAARRARMMLASYRAIINTIRGLAYVAALYIGAHEVLLGGRTGLVRAGVSLGLFQGTLAIFRSMSRGTYNLVDLWGSLQDVTVAVARVFEMLNRRPENELAGGVAVPAPPRVSLAFDGVGFAYDGRVPVLTELNFTARVGEITAVMGPSGSGKSTLVGLLLRFFDPSSGRILLDGRDIRDFDTAAYRSLYAAGLQENPLFTATLRDNLLYGRPEATAKEIERAIEQAGLLDFVRELPAGLETMLGEKGAKLSIGQAQRISLARAFLRDAPILLLDEPTSALGAATEDHVMRSLRAWVAAKPALRMAIIATHRASTAARADRSFRIADGRILAAQESAGAAPDEAQNG